MEPKGSWERGYKEGYAKNIFDRDKAADLLRRVKAWRDSPGNECFPFKLREEIDIFLAALAKEKKE